MEITSIVVDGSAGYNVKQTVTDNSNNILAFEGTSSLIQEER